MEFLYSDGDDYYFMNPVDYEQTTLLPIPALTAACGNDNAPLASLLPITGLELVITDSPRPACCGSAS